MDSVKRVVLASGNPGKLREMRQLLAGLGLDIVPQSELSVPETEESGLSFVENAILKARNAARWTGLPAIADDSGIEVD
ncbi:MAG: non-canonical purine NTP pyrophosphatase, partial [Longimicrobiales bacterium]